ncbi:tetratricopeptide repeat protein [Kordiimonas pumila]|uniref:Tetratricopeptide repeat protein n=1 Tax=Kordiimonas pumila TaxID=2161677 RepID=A0ABV7D2G0_9PROT|nr:tetratricopeptide repeat protein [Kordiimonas pumila]
MPEIFTFILRIILACVLGFASGCSSGPSKRTTESEGPITAYARNTLASENPLGLVRVGEGFERSGNLQGALNLYGQAMTADPSLIEAQIAFARIRGLLGDTEQAITMLTSLLTEHAENVSIRKNIVTVYIAAGELRAARLFIGPLLNNNNIDIEVLTIAGKLDQALGKGEDARQHFEQALSLEPTNPEVLRNIGLSFALDNNYSSAIALIQQSMDQASGITLGKKALATVYALSGQYQLALQIARTAMPLEEANSMHFFYKLLPQLEEQAKAQAVLFGQMPTGPLNLEMGAVK